MKSNSAIETEGVCGYKNRLINPYEKGSVNEFLWNKGYWAAMGAADRQLGREYYNSDNAEKALCYDLGWVNPSKYGY